MSDRVHFICSIFWYLVLTIGCFWQISDVCRFHFDYPTKVFIETKFDPISKPLPAITFCTNIGLQEDRNSSEVLDIESGKIRNGLFIYIFVRDLENGGSNWVDLVNSSIRWLDNVVEQISLEYYCLTLNSQLKANNETVLKRSRMIRFSLNRFGIYNDWWIQFHNSFDLPTGSEWNALRIIKGQHFHIKWNLNSFKLLRSPYRTDCKDYRLEGEYLSRKDCIRQCKLNVSISKCGAIANGINIMFGEESVRFGSSQQKSECIEKIDLDEIFGQICPHYDCLIEFYEPVKYGEWGAIDRALLDVSIPIKPETVYYHSPRIETIEFICYLASTFSMWFGFSMLSLYSLIDILRNRYSKPGQNKFKLHENSGLFENKGIPREMFNVMYKGSYMSNRIPRNRF